MLSLKIIISPFIEPASKGLVSALWKMLGVPSDLWSSLWSTMAALAPVRVVIRLLHGPCLPIGEAPGPRDLAGEDGDHLSCGRARRPGLMTFIVRRRAQRALAAAGDGGGANHYLGGRRRSERSKAGYCWPPSLWTKSCEPPKRPRSASR